MILYEDGATMLIKTIKIYNFNELSEDIQQSLIEEELNKQYGISYWDYEVYSQDVLDNWKEKLENMGFNDVKIRYTGFCSQGDGASFTSDNVNLGKVIDIDKFCQQYNLRKLFVKILLKYLECKIIDINHHYSHPYSVTTDIDYYIVDFKHKNKIYKLIDTLIDKLCSYINNMQVTYAYKIYRELEEQYYHCYSEEHIKDYLIEYDDTLYFADGTEYNDKMDNIPICYAGN